MSERDNHAESGRPAAQPTVGDEDQTITAPTPPQGRDSFEPGEFEEKRQREEHDEKTRERR